MARIPIGDSKIRLDEDTGFICVTDMAGFKGDARDNIKNWMRNANSILFFEAWEAEHNPNFKGVEFDPFKLDAGDNTFKLSATQLVEAGATGLFVTRGRYGGTFCHVDWATHFANWLDARFYVRTLRTFREMSDRIYGREQGLQRFSRELAAKNYGLITQANDQRKFQPLPHPNTSNRKTGGNRKIVSRQLNIIDADLLNLAMWDMSARQWQLKFPQYAGTKNMRDFATPEELQTIAALQVILRHLQEDSYTSTEKYSRLAVKARELLKFYCDTPEKVAKLEARREERGWR